MPKFLIEREIPGAGNMTAEQLRAAADNSNTVIRELGSEIKWITSYIADDKVCCVFVAPSEEVVMEHARCAGLPADRISKIVATIDPSTGEATDQPSPRSRARTSAAAG